MGCFLIPCPKKGAGHLVFTEFVCVRELACLGSFSFFQPGVGLHGIGYGRGELLKVLFEYEGTVALKLPFLVFGGFSDAKVGLAVAGFFHVEEIRTAFSFNRFRK